MTTLVGAGQAAVGDRAPEPPPVRDPPRADDWSALLSALLAAAAFGWLAAGPFTGALPQVVAAAGTVFGVATVWVSLRSRHPASWQYGGAGAAVLVAGLLVLPSADAAASVPQLVADAVRGGGLSQPPVLFEPGWRFVLFLLTALLGQTAAGVAVALRRPRLAAAVATPLVVGAALLQTPGRELSTTLVGLLLLVASLAVPSGEDGDTPVLALRRMARGAGALIVLGGVLAGAAQVGLLFPTASAERVIPSMRPRLPPTVPDRVLFTVTAAQPLTWRLGTLDVYRSPAWLTPPFDPARLVRLGRDGRVPAAARAETHGPIATTATTTVRVTIGNFTGRVVPALVDPLRVTGGPALTYDPRTQELRTAGSAPAPGTRYDVTAAILPTSAQLAAAGPPGPAARPFLDVPPAPPQVVALLAAAPSNSFARLQYVRRAYFAKVVAAGAGTPVDVSPSRVAELLSGQPGSPYEITAGEVLLARWAGVPARIGYGYYGGTAVTHQPSGGPNTVEVRPRNGATWLEAYFQGSGWVPIVGTPPRARIALDTQQQNGDPSVRASTELALVVYVPVRLPTVALLYAAVRYYALRVLPLAVGALTLFLVLPGLARAARRATRRRVAGRAGRQARLAAAYAELRDLCTDLAIGKPGLTPLAFLEVVAPDPEHTELAWLVTRGLWGDLGRDLDDADVVAAEEMARSVSGRLRRAQPGFSRAAAFTSRRSLRQPWTRELPVGWPSRSPRWPVTGAAVTLLTLAGVGIALLASGPAAGPPVGPALPERVAPRTVGDVSLVAEVQAQRAYRQSPLIQDGRVFSLHQADVVQGSLQVAGFRAGLDTRSARVRQQVLAGLGGGLFQPARLGDERIYRLDRPEQVLLLAFTPDGRGYYLMVGRARFAEADQVFAAVLAFRRGADAGVLRADVTAPDPRRGGSA